MHNASFASFWEIVLCRFFARNYVRNHLLIYYHSRLSAMMSIMSKWKWSFEVKSMNTKTRIRVVDDDLLSWIKMLKGIIVAGTTPS